MDERLFNITLISVHAPTGDTEEEEKDDFYEMRKRLYDMAPRHDENRLLGDF